ncbi:MAG: 50S ribosomal protein L4 [Candidatus Aminicenantes bacterium]|nr:50S ribosomal protein L4 [Candidatus Aminicenantes bacterium]
MKIAKAQVLTASGKVAGEVELPARVFDYPVKGHLLYESVVQRRASERRGTASTKTRGEVSGSSRKPWRQKGTGRARAGSIRSPLWRKGGTIFGPRPRDYRFEIPKQAKRSALKAALSLRFSENRLIILDAVNFKAPKTKEAADFLKALNLDSALIVDKNENRNLFLALRNVPGVKAIDAGELSAYDVLAHKWLVLTQRALASLTERF